MGQNVLGQVKALDVQGQIVKLPLMTTVDIYCHSLLSTLLSAGHSPSHWLLITT